MNLRKGFSLVACIAGALLASCGSAPQKEVSVEQFGAIPNDGKNDFEALRKATAYCRENPGTTLFFPPGMTSTTRRLVRLSLKLSAVLMARMYKVYFSDLTVLM